jgi:NAD(P)-dependent dehydrogenase (short-subunit alcohol dehydrogenase family)
MRFDDQVIIVSGGASGMGRATATLLAQHGARVVIADIDEEAGRRVADAIGPSATLEPTDLRSLPDITALVARTRDRFGRIDGVANVAAIYPFQTFLDVAPEDWQDVDDVNHRAVFFLAQAVARAMIDDGRSGAIVNVASGAAFRAVPGQAAYTGTKGAVVAMTRLMAHELLPHGIRANVVAPGHTASETVLRWTTQEQRDAMAASLVGQRWMEPEEVAEAIAFLLSDEARGMTGAVIHVNEGNYMPH